MLIRRAAFLEDDDDDDDVSVVTSPLANVYVLSLWHKKSKSFPFYPVY